MKVSRALILAVLLAAGSAVAGPAAASPAPTPVPTPAPTPGPQPSPGTSPVPQSPCRTGPISTIPPQNTAPTQPGTPVAGWKFFGGVFLTWAAATDDQEVYCYEIYRTGPSGGNDILAGVVQGSQGSNARTDALVSLPTPIISRTYTLYIVAVDRWGVRGPRSGTLDVTISNDIIQPPPSNVAVTPLSPTSARVTWSLLAGAAQPSAYSIELDGVSAGTSTTTTFTLTGLEPGRTYSVAVRALYSEGSIGYPSQAVTFTTSADAYGCEVRYTTHGWNDGMTSSLKITNTGAVPISDWVLRFDFPHPGQRVNNGWSATWTQSGATVTAAAPAWKRTLAPGASITIGFNGTHTGANPVPAAFTINGAPCGS